MSDLVSLKKRRSSVLSTSKITSAVNNIASATLAKLRGYLSILEENREFCENLEMKIRPKSHVNYIIVLGTDRGLCGNFNMVAYKKLLALYEKKKYDHYKILVFGTRLHKLVKNSGIDHVEYCNYEKNNNKTILKMLELLKSHPAVTIVYRKFENVVFQDIKTFNIQHLELENDISGEFDENTFYDTYLNIILYYALINNFASEEAGRMMLMDSATKNAKELASGLALKINRIRQTGITRQLIEIISGIESLKKSDE